LILFFLNNFKSTATNVTQKFRFILLKILNKTMFGKLCADNILAVMFIGNFHIKIKFILAPFFLFIDRF